MSVERLTTELATTFAADGLRLDGALHRSTDVPPREPATPVDAVLLLHGTGSNFYGSRFLTFLAERFAAAGIACLIANTRGHDMISTALVRLPGGGFDSRKIGAAYERVAESPLDVQAWVALLQQRGYRRIAVIGHSLGAVKAIYSAVNGPLLGVVMIVAMSPPRLSFAHFTANVRNPRFANDVAAAERHVAEGRPDALMEILFPIPMVITAAGYLDKYGREERYNLLNFVDRLPVPTLFTYGSVELQQGVTFRGMPEALDAARDGGATNVKTGVVAGGDHHYTGVQDDLFALIARWLQKTAAAAPAEGEDSRI